MLKNESFYCVHGWMLNTLKLKSTQLIIYAIIYGFTQDGKSQYHGSIGYLAEFTGLTRECVRTNLDKLIEKGLIEKKLGEAGGVNYYRAVIKEQDEPVKMKIQNADADEVIEYLNEKTGSRYTKSAGQHIVARLNEGFSVEDCKKVIDIKYEEWNGTDMAKYLRPQTLFGAKFQSYLNQKAKEEVKRSYNLNVDYRPLKYEKRG